MSLNFKKILITSCLSFALTSQAGPIFEKGCPNFDKAGYEIYHTFNVLRCPNNGVVTIHRNNRTWTGTFVKDTNSFVFAEEPGVSKNDFSAITYFLLQARNGEFLQFGDAPRIKSVLIEVETNCTNQTRRDLRFLAFSENFATGDVIAEMSPPSNWRHDPSFTSLVCVRP